MDTPELDPDARALLENMGVSLDPPQVEDSSNDGDAIVWQPPADDGATAGAQQPAPAAAAAPPDYSQFVPKSAFDQLQQQNAQLQQQIGELAARMTQAPPQAYQPAHGGVGAPVSDDPRIAKLNQEFFENPVATLAKIMPMFAQAQSAPLQQQQVATQTALAHTQLHSLRAAYSNQYPDIAPKVLARVDRLVAETPPQELARLAVTGALAAEYDKAFKASAGEVMLPVYQTAAQRRAASAQQAAPPALTGGTAGTALGGVTNIRDRIAGKQTIRMSDLSEADRIAVEEGAKLGIPAEVILAQEA